MLEGIEALVGLCLVGLMVIIFVCVAKALTAGVRTMFVWATDRGAWGALVMLILWAAATPLMVLIAIYIGVTRG